MNYKIKGIISRLGCDRTVTLRDMQIIDNQGAEYNVLKAIDDNSVKLSNVDLQYTFSDALLNIFSSMILNKSIATFVIDYGKKEIIALEIE